MEQESAEKFILNFYRDLLKEHDILLSWDSLSLIIVPLEYEMLLDSLFERDSLFSVSRNLNSAIEFLQDTKEHG